jgi:hypothetical protein
VRKLGEPDARLEAEHVTQKKRLSGLTFGGPRFSANAIKFILGAWGVKPLPRFLETVLEAQFKGDRTPPVELAGARQLARLGFDMRELLHRCLVTMLIFAQNITTRARMKTDRRTQKKPRELSFGASSQLGVHIQHGRLKTTTLLSRLNPRSPAIGELDASGFSDQSWVFVIEGSAGMVSGRIEGRALLKSNMHRR